MNVAELIRVLEDYDPELQVYVSSSDHDYDWMTLHKEHISTEYVYDAEEDNETKALCLGDGY
jgi:hypothetical protein